jgi:prepilin-type N-terminal cleavage/methylation domain-containing protein
MTRLRDEAGFTLVELLASMVIGTVVILASWMIVDSSGKLSTRTTSRVDAYQRGRLALDQIASELRSQVCLPGGIAPIEPLVTGPNDVWFYNNTGDQDAVPQQRHIYFANGAIREELWTGNFAGPPTSSRLLLSDVALVPLTPGPGNEPFVRYFGFDANLPAAVNQELPTPVSVVNAPKVVQVNISFVARPSRATAASALDSVFQQSVYFRTADPTDPAKGPRCQ